jgi:hypothetical protein
MKKFIALILVFSLLAGALLCFASCDGKEDTNADGKEDTEQGGSTDNNDDAGNGGDSGNNDNDNENTEPDLTDDTYPEDVANDIF